MDTIIRAWNMFLTVMLLVLIAAIDYELDGIVSRMIASFYILKCIYQ